MTQYKTVEVVCQGSDVRGQGQLDELLADGWQITDEDDSETWTYEGGGGRGTVHCRLIKYSLRKD